MLKESGKRGLKGTRHFDKRWVELDAGVLTYYKASAPKKGAAKGAAPSKKTEKGNIALAAVSSERALGAVYFLREQEGHGRRGRERQAPRRAPTAKGGRPSEGGGRTALLGASGGRAADRDWPHSSEPRNGGRAEERRAHHAQGKERGAAAAE